MKTSDLCDARADVLVCDLPWIGFGTRRFFAGAIRTVRYVDGIGAIRDLLDEPGHDSVLVIDGAAAPGGALFGDMMAARAIRNGWAGIVVHGFIRDRAEIDVMDIGVKALGTVPRRVEIAGTSEVDAPLAFGGVTFLPGSRLVADEDGIVVLPPGVSEADLVASPSR